MIATLAALLLALPPAVRVTSASAEAFAVGRHRIIVVRAGGTTDTRGWKDARLTPVGVGPRDGYLEFRLTAEPPRGPFALPALGSVSAAIGAPMPPGPLKGVRVLGADSSVEARIEGP